MTIQGRMPENIIMVHILNLLKINRSHCEYAQRGVAVGGQPPSFVIYCSLLFCTKRHDKRRKE